jgi:enoyl-CoA hydratase/carnithine racemase
MIKELCDAIKTLHEDTGVNVIVIVSELTNIFCAGADIKWFSKSSFDYEFGMRH